jgi:peroxiredoxin
MGIWQEFKERGVIVWGIGSEDSQEVLRNFRDQMGLTFPILFDDGAVVQDDYNPGSVPTNSIYPQDWIIGVDGKVAYVNTVYEPEEMRAILETELARVE